MQDHWGFTTSAGQGLFGDSFADWLMLREGFPLFNFLQVIVPQIVVAIIMLDLVRRAPQKRREGYQDYAALPGSAARRSRSHSPDPSRGERSTTTRLEYGDSTHSKLSRDSECSVGSIAASTVAGTGGLGGDSDAAEALVAVEEASREETFGSAQGAKL